jgi:hypothetical protein
MEMSFITTSSPILRSTQGLLMGDELSFSPRVPVTATTDSAPVPI